MLCTRNKEEFKHFTTEGHSKLFFWFYGLWDHQIIAFHDITRSLDRESNPRPLAYARVVRQAEPGGATGLPNCHRGRQAEGRPPNSFFSFWLPNHFQPHETSLFQPLNLHYKGYAGAIYLHQLEVEKPWNTLLVHPSNTGHPWAWTVHFGAFSLVSWQISFVGYLWTNQRKEENWPNMFVKASNMWDIIRSDHASMNKISWYI
jgi:hypothetical protein